MCGIAGHVHWQGGVDMPALERMVSALAHRGPDDSGIWRSADGLCALGHRRLSVIDLSQAGHQPMIDPLTGNSIVFNGEIYNHRDLRRRCESAGDVFQSNSDTEVVLALYRRYGVNCLHSLRGMFSIALWDNARRQIFLARDRLGKKPLNYALTPSGVVFASEIFPLSKHPAVSDKMDLEALELYFQLQSIPAPWTIYRDVRKLPPGHFVLADCKSFTIQRYWSLDYRHKGVRSESEALEAFEEKLTDAVRVRMISDVPLGAMLSGGVDSSVVVALMAKLADAPVRTFSVGFSEEGLNELPYAQRAADRFGTRHHPQIVQGDVERMLPMIARHYGEPFADSSAVPSFLVCQEARRHVTVVLNGDGGDELLGGYARYTASQWGIVSGRALGSLLGPRGLISLVPHWSAMTSLPARALRRILHDFVSPEIGGLLMFIGYWNDDRRAQLLDGCHDSSLLPRWRLNWMSEAFEHADNPIERMLWLDNHTYLPNDLLVKMDVAAMHCGLESRSPLLDHEVIELCASFPPKLKVNRGTGKYLLKKLALKYFPPDFVHRRKMGFGVPLTEWLRGPLRSYAESIVLDPNIMAPLNQQEVRNCWANLLNGNQGRDAEAARAWALLMYGQWRQSVQSVPT